MSNEMKAKKPITQWLTRKEVRLVQIRKQIIYCGNCNAELPTAQAYEAKFCSQCGCPIDWYNFMTYPAEFVKLLPSILEEKNESKAKE